MPALGPFGLHVNDSFGPTPGLNDVGSHDGNIQPRQLQFDICSRMKACGSCALNYPACAWCATESRCYQAPLSILHTPDSQKLVYKADVYNDTYGFVPRTVVFDGTCGAWIKDADTCRDTEHDCDTNDTEPEGCHSCLSKSSGRCGMCVRKGSRGTCRPGVGRIAFGFRDDLESHDQCDGPDDEWLFGDWLHHQHREKCVVGRCPRDGEVLDEEEGTINVGSELQQIGVKANTSCRWLLWPDRSTYLGEEDTVVRTAIRKWVDDPSGPHHVQLRYWEGEPPSRLNVSSAVGWSVGRVFLDARPQSSPAFTNVKPETPVIVEFNSPSVLEGAVTIKWDVDQPGGGSGDDSSQHSVATVAMTWWLLGLAFTTVICGMASLVLLRRVAQRRLIGDGFRSPTRNRATARDIAQGERMVVEELVQAIPSLQPKVMQASDFEDEQGGTCCCSVCLLDLQVGDQARVLPCGHPFHAACIDGWLERSTRCPLCRYSLTADLHKVDQDTQTGGQQRQAPRAPAAWGRNVILGLPPAGVQPEDTGDQLPSPSSGTLAASRQASSVRAVAIAVDVPSRGGSGPSSPRGEGPSNLAGVAVAAEEPSQHGNRRRQDMPNSRSARNTEAAAWEESTWDV